MQTPGGPNRRLNGSPVVQYGALHGEPPELRPAPAATALILALPELAAFTSRWRAISYAPGHPQLPLEMRFAPHITLLTPWANPGDSHAMGRLHDIARRHDAFDLVFVGASRFPSSTVTFLEPTPRTALDALLMDVWDTFPEFPPYAGEHPRPTPHVTVSADGDEKVLAQVRAALSEHGPVRARASSISVTQRGPDTVWREVGTASLG